MYLILIHQTKQCIRNDLDITNVNITKYTLFNTILIRPMKQLQGDCSGEALLKSSFQIELVEV